MCASAVLQAANARSELPDSPSGSNGPATPRSRLCAGRPLPFPDFEQDYEFVALSHPDEYPLNEGRIVSNRGLDIAGSEYDDHFLEEHVAYSNALHSSIKGRGAYFGRPDGPLQPGLRQALATARAAARGGSRVTMPQPVPEHHRSRRVEVLYACDEALRIIAEYNPPDSAFDRRRAARRYRLRRHRSSARAALSSLPH